MITASTKLTSEPPQYANFHQSNPAVSPLKTAEQLVDLFDRASWLPANAIV